MMNRCWQLQKTKGSKENTSEHKEMHCEDEMLTVSEEMRPATKEKNLTQTV